MADQQKDTRPRAEVNQLVRDPQTGEITVVNKGNLLPEETKG